jgi:hypothetical protein
MFHDNADRNSLQIPQGLERRPGDEVPYAPLQLRCLWRVEDGVRVADNMPFDVLRVPLPRCPRPAYWWLNRRNETNYGAWVE